MKSTNLIRVISIVFMIYTILSLWLIVQLYQKPIENTTELGNGNVGGTCSKPEEKIALLMICYKRHKSLARALDKVMGYIPPSVDLVISQDGSIFEMTEFIDGFRKNNSKKGINIVHLQNSDREPPVLKSPAENSGYYYIAQHYRFALHNIFLNGYDFAIILEEDIDIAPDFFSYFLALKEILKSDESLFCISAWNDNGASQFVRDPAQLYRSDFFPGLGWMLTKKFWREIGGIWPPGYWDDWLRDNKRRKNRHCIFPEISRTYTFGFDDGVSSGQYASEYLTHVTLNTNTIEWEKKDLEYMKLENYNKQFQEILKNSVPIKSIDMVQNFKNSSLIFEYELPGNLGGILQSVGLMANQKDHIWRGSYYGVIAFWKGSNKVYIAPRGARENLEQINPKSL